MGSYRVAEVCLNGHVSTSRADTIPERREKFCSHCGEPTTTQCTVCNSSVRGYYDVPGVITLGAVYEPPAFCHNCGSSFPWTERKILSAVELVEHDASLSPEEIQQFRSDLTELTKDSPKTQIASLRFKNVMSKVGSSVASGVREIIVGVLSDAAKKAIFGG